MRSTPAEGGARRRSHRAPAFQNYEPRLASRAASRAPPTLLCTLPTTLSALPSASILVSPVMWPTPSLIAPLACFSAPSIRSLSIVMLLFDVPPVATATGSGVAAPIGRHSPRDRISPAVPRALPEHNAAWCRMVPPVGLSDALV